MVYVMVWFASYVLRRVARNEKLMFNFVGVAQVMNRIDGYPFDEHDDQLFEVHSYI